MPIHSVVVDEGHGSKSLSYASDVEVPVGYAVEVPYGATTKRGVVVGPGETVPGLKSITRVYGVRTDAGVIAVAEAARTFYATSSLWAVYQHLAPAHYKGNPATKRTTLPRKEGHSGDRFYFLGPAATTLYGVKHAISQQQHRGQVLVLCADRYAAEQIADHVPGAAFLDPAPGKGQPSAWRGFTEGLIQIGVATKAGVLWGTSKVQTIIVCDDLHPGYTEQKVPYWNAADVALLRARVTGASYVTVSHRASRTSTQLPIEYVPGPEGKLFVIDRSDASGGQRDVPTALYAKVKSLQKQGPCVFLVNPTATWWCGSCKTVGTGLTHCEHCEHCGSDRRTELSWSAKKVKTVFGANCKTMTLSTMLRDASRVHAEAAVIIPDVDGFLLSPSYTAGALYFSAMASSRQYAGSQPVLLCTNMIDHPFLGGMLLQRQHQPVIDEVIAQHEGAIGTRWLVVGRGTGKLAVAKKRALKACALLNLREEPDEWEFDGLVTLAQLPGLQKTMPRGGRLQVSYVA